MVAPRAFQTSFCPAVIWTPSAALWASAITITENPRVSAALIVASTQPTEERPVTMRSVIPRALSSAWKTVPWNPLGKRF